MAILKIRFGIGVFLVLSAIAFSGREFIGLELIFGFDLKARQLKSFE